MNGNLDRRLGAAEGKVRASEHANGPSRIDLPPLVVAPGQEPTEEQTHEGVPEGYILFLFPAPEEVDANGTPIAVESVEWVRIAFRGV